MSPPPIKGEAFAHGDGAFARCQLTSTFIDESVRPIVERVMRDVAREAAHATAYGALLRVTAWIRSLARLNHPADYQAVSSGSRALLEIAVDLTLLHHAPSAHPHDRIAAWEGSALLRQAERLVAFYNAAGGPLPTGVTEAAAFVAREGPKIRALRAKHWPSGKHPERWTGRKLDQDVREADKVAPYNFAAFYAERYAHLCWATHGSGLAGVRSLPEEHFPGVTAIAFGECARFATTSCELILRLVDRYDQIAQVRFQKLERDQSRAHAEVFYGQRSTESRKG